MLGSDGGTFAAKPSCPGSTSACEGACPDGGAVCLGNCGFLPPVLYALGGAQAEMVVGDLQGDGSEDLVTADTQGNSLQVLVNRGRGLFQTASRWKANAPSSVALARIDGNASLDMLFANGGNSTFGVYRGRGDGTFDPPVTASTPSPLRSVAVWEYNGIRRVAAIREDAIEVSVFPVNGDGSLGTPVAYGAFAPLHSLLVADLNGDGRPDIVGSYPNTCVPDLDVPCQSVGVLLGRSDGTFEPVRVTSTGGTPLGIVAARLDPDALTDLIVADSSRHQVLVLLGRADGSFVVQASFPTVRSPSSLALVDINRDTVLDLVVGSLGNQVSVLLGQPGGSFAPQVPLTASLQEAGILSLAGSDFDKDGFKDLAALTRTGVQMLWGICR